MQVTERAFFVLLTFSLCAPAQVLAPPEIRDPQMRELQQKYLAELKLITQAAAMHTFPYRFYFSRTLDLAEKDQAASDQRSVQFDWYQGKVVLKITGNYFASYSTELMSAEDRARQTYRDVMLPLLQSVTPALLRADELLAFAFEISHHVRKKVLGVSSEGVENVVLILPRASAERFALAANSAAQEAALAEGEVFLNAATISLWAHAQPVTATGSAAAFIAKAVAAAPVTSPGLLRDGATQSAAKLAVAAPPKEPSPVSSSVDSRPATIASAELRDASPDSIRNIQKTYQDALNRMVQDLNAQAHFVRYAPPAFIPFHKGLYLQLSLTTMLPEPAGGSQYKLAALAFDQHIAHLIRPALSSFREDRGDFDGIDFSTSIRLTAGQVVDGGSLAVEFIFPLSQLRAYEQFDCTGQQLIDAGFVLINGERVSLNLQAAEDGFQARP